MLDGRLFEKLEAIARRVRGNDVCFGGIQLIVCGDFFQLPPVGLGKNNVIYCFESACWNEVIQVGVGDGSSAEDRHHEEGVSPEGRAAASAAARHSLRAGARWR